MGPAVQHTCRSHPTAAVPRGGAATAPERLAREFRLAAPEKTEVVCCWSNVPVLSWGMACKSDDGTSARTDARQQDQEGEALQRLTSEKMCIWQEARVCQRFPPLLPVRQPIRLVFSHTGVLQRSNKIIISAPRVTSY
jgi:hypothetical protein